MAFSCWFFVQSNLCSSCHTKTALHSSFKPGLCMPNQGQRIFFSIKKGRPCSIGKKDWLLNETSIASPITRAMPASSEAALTFSTAFVDSSSKNPDANVIICDYLKSLGIDTEELEELALPTTVDVMKERVEFLQKLGLSIEDINDYPLMLGCSVKRNMVPILDYLEKLGVSKSALPDLLRRYPQVLHSSVVIDLQPVVKFLRGLDIKANDIPRVIESYPELLGFKLEGTMSTSVAYLVSIGVDRRSIGAMLTRCPQILAMRVGRVIKPIVDYLISLRLRKEVVARILEKKPYILGFSLEEQMKQNVESLLSFGVRYEALASIIAQYPEILGLDLKPKLILQQDFFKSYMKIGPEDFGKLLEKMPQVAVLSQDPVLKRIELLSAWGFSSEDITKMVVTCPQLLALNMDVMTLCFNYFRHEMNRSLRDLVDFPAYFTYSLETRIKPRFRKLSRKGIKCSLSWFLSCSDERFAERLDAEYIEIDEMEPSFSFGGPLGSAEKESSSEDDDEETEYGEEIEKGSFTGVHFPSS